MVVVISSNFVADRIAFVVVKFVDVVNVDAVGVAVEVDVWL